MSLFATRSRAAAATAAAVALLLLSILAGAPSPVGAASAGPCATLTLGVSPPTVAPGGTVTVSGTLTNCSAKTEKLRVVYDVSGPCAYADHYSVNVTLPAGEARSAAVSRVAPSCPGTYTVTGTVSSGTTPLASATTSFTVQ